MKAKWLRIYETIGKIEMAIAATGLALLTALVFYSAVARTLRHPAAWAVDAATFLFAWCVFLGADLALRHDQLFRITLLVDRLPPKAKNALHVINYVIILVFLAAMTVYGFWLSYTTRYRTFQGIPGFSYTWVTLSVPVGCLLMLVTTALKLKPKPDTPAQEARDLF